MPHTGSWCLAAIDLLTRVTQARRRTWRVPGPVVWIPPLAMARIPNRSLSAARAVVETRSRWERPVNTSGPQGQRCVARCLNPMQGQRAASGHKQVADSRAANQRHTWFPTALANPDDPSGLYRNGWHTQFVGNLCNKVFRIDRFGEPAINPGWTSLDTHLARIRFADSV